MIWIMLSVTWLSVLKIILLYSKYDWTSDLWQQLELASKLECDPLRFLE